MNQQDDNPFPWNALFQVVVIFTLLGCMVYVTKVYVIDKTIALNAREYAAKEIKPQDYLVVKNWQKEYPSGPIHDLIAKSLEDGIVTHGELAEINKIAGLDIKERLK